MSEAASNALDPAMRQQITEMFQRLQQERARIAQNAVELESEKRDHIVVMKRLEPMDKSRSCYKLVGGVLVERKVGDVLPGIVENTKQLEAIIQQLNKNVDEKTKEIAQFMQKYNIRVGPRE